MEIQVAYQQLIAELGKQYASGEASSIARIVFEDAFGIHNFSRTDLLDELQIRQLTQISKRLNDGEPVQYALGQASFYGLNLTVDSSVLIPRQETEELVHWILNDHPEQDPLRILDIGSGSGCIPLALKANWSAAMVTAVDISAAALAIGRKNAAQLGLDVEFQQVDILKEEDWQNIGQFDVIVSNPPYIPTSEKALMPGHVLNYEPSLALFVEDEDPLIFYRKIAKLALQKLSPKGRLYYETNEFNAQQVLELLQKEGFVNIELRKDMQKKDRMICAQKPRSLSS